jgi:hypothetical protein
MKPIIPIFLLLVLSLCGCGKRGENFCGTWESKTYDAYIHIVRQDNIYLVSVQEKTGKSWIGTPSVMYYDYGLLRSRKQAFRSISYDPRKQSITINGEADEWTKKSEEAAM